jgi:hypothetical protein
MRLPTRTSLFYCAALVGLTSALMAPAAPSADDVSKAEKAVKEYLDTVKGSAGKVEQVKDEPVQTLLPKAIIFAVRFPQYPVARVVPDGLKASNVFVVDGDGKVTAITESKGLLKLFSSLEVKTDAAAKDAARAYLRLNQELHQDGFYKFSLMDDSTKVTTEKGARKVTAKVVVMAGGNGEIGATLSFDDKGKLSKIDDEVKLKPGPRPICQATKLLDLDPIVRRMAEQDLRCMGRAVKDYLDEQRAKAGPDLRRAIDALWQRICEEDR